VTTEPLFKVLGPDREAIHGGTGVWPEPGEWLSVDGPVEPCARGLHLCRARDLAEWVREGAWVWRAETSGVLVDAGDKVVVARARLVGPVGVLSARVLRLFAADCAESVAHLHGHHPACMEAIRVARLYAHGLTTDERRVAAGDAAWVAARAVAGTAARAAARAADWAAAGDAAGDAAWDVAGAVTWASAGAAGDAAWDAARAAQGANLLALTARYGKVAA